MEEEQKETNSDTLSPKKKAVAEAYRMKLSNIALACREVGISRMTFYRWLKEDPIFKEVISNTEHYNINMVESALMQACIKGNPTAIIFFLTNREKDRWKHIKTLEGELKHTFDASLLQLIHKAGNGSPEGTGKSDSPEDPDSS